MQLLLAVLGASGEWSGGYGAYLWQTFLALIAVSALAVLVLRLLRKRGRSATGALRVLARLDLEPRRSLYAVKALDRVLLLGVGDGTMVLLAELDPNKINELEVQEKVTPGMVELLKRAFGRGKDRE